MTRLAAVLAGALLDTFCWDRRPEAVAKDADQLVAAIPEPERSALEAALDVCGREGCGLIRGHPWHIADHEHGKHSPLPRCHPFVPLGDPS